MIRKGILKSFEPGTHRATVQIIGSLSTWLTIPTTHGIAAVDMVDGSYVAVLTPDESKPGDSVVIAVWTPATGPYEFGITLNYWLGNQVLTETLTEAEAVLTETPSSSPETLTTITFKSAVLDTPTPFTIVEGALIEIHFTADETSGAGRNEGLSCVLGYVDADGTSNFVEIGSESHPTDPLTTTKTNYTLHIHIASDTAVPAGKRLWLKFIATTVSGAGGYPELNVYYDSTGHHMLVPVAGSVLAAYIPKALLSVRGDILYRNATEPDRLAKGAEGEHLTMGVNEPKWSPSATKAVFETAAAGIMSITDCADTHFDGLINGAPTATAVSYDTDTGAYSINGATTYTGRIILHNTTRGNSRKIIAANRITKVITTVSTVDDWATNDIITTKDPLINEAGFISVCLGNVVPPNTTAMLALIFFKDTGGLNQQFRTTTYEPYSISHTIPLYNLSTTIWTTLLTPLIVIDQKIGWKVTASGATTAQFVLKYFGYFIDNP